MARLDSQALLFDPFKTGLNRHQEIFCRSYVQLDANALAAVRVTFPELAKAPNAAVSKKAKLLLKSAKVQARIAELEGMVVAAIVVDKARVIEEQARIAFADPREALDADGRLLPLASMPAHVASALKRVRFRTVVVRETGTDGVVRERAESVPDELEFQPKIPVLDQLSKHLGLYEADNLQRSRPDWESLPAELKTQIRAKLLEAAANVGTGDRPELDRTAIPTSGGLITH